MLYTTHQEDYTLARVNINKKNLINILRQKHTISPSI
jgi:hypothetical protein